MKGRLHWLNWLWFGGIDPIRLDMFRRAFSLSLLVYVAERAHTPFEWLSHEGFHASPDAYWWWYPPTLPVLPTWAVIPFLALFMLAIAALVIGRYVRVCTWLVWAGVLYITAADYMAAYSLNVFYCLCFGVLALAPPLVSGTGGDRTVVRQSAWPVRVIQGAIMIQYFTAGTCKFMYGDWFIMGGIMKDDNLLRITEWFGYESRTVLWTHAQGIYCTDLCAWMLRNLPIWTWAAMQYSALGFEVTAPITLGVKKLRWVGIFWGCGFLLMITLTMNKLFFFTFQLMCFFILFIDASHLRHMVELARRSTPGRWLFANTQ